MKTMLITGASGFIGRNMVEWFRGKYDLLTPSHKELELTNENKVKEYFDNHNIDYVVNCASKDQGQCMFNNLFIFFNLIEQKFEKMINFGSGAEFNKQNSIVKAKEDDLFKNPPIDQYGYSKFIMAKYLRTKEAPNNVYNLRLFGVFRK